MRDKSLQSTAMDIMKARTNPSGIESEERHGRQTPSRQCDLTRGENEGDGTAP